MPKPKTITRWSYSSWSDFNKCAFKWMMKFRYGMKEPKGPAVARGEAHHKLAESYLKGKIYGGVPKALAKLGYHYKQLAKLHPVVEKFWNLDEDWRPVRDKEDAWVTMKMDAAVPPNGYPLFIQDLKTGREYDGHADQASLYACIGVVKFPDTDGVDVEFWYSDGGYVQQYHFTPRVLRNHTERWQERGEEMMAMATRRKPLLPTPSKKTCDWCFLRTDKGGPCSAWKTVKGVKR